MSPGSFLKLDYSRILAERTSERTQDSCKGRKGTKSERTRGYPAEAATGRPKCATQVIQQTNPNPEDRRVPKQRGRRSLPNIQKDSGDAPQGYSWRPLLLLAPPRRDPCVLWNGRTQGYPCHENVENKVKETEDTRVPLELQGRPPPKIRLYSTRA